MNPEFRMLFFRGGRQREQLLLNGNILELPVAQIICNILQLEDAFFEKVREIPKRLDKIADDYRAAIKDAYTYEENDVGLKYLKIVKDCLNSLFDLDLSAEERQMMQLQVYLPCFEAYSQAYDTSERLLAGTRYQNELLNILNSGKETDDQRVKEYVGTLYKGGHSHSASAAWRNFIDLMADGIKYGLWSVAAEAIFDETGIYRSYAERFDDCIVELWRLKKDLQYAWDERDNNHTLSDLKQHLMGPRVISSKNNNMAVFPTETGFVRKGEVYGIISFTELVMAELKLLDEIDRPIRKCKICGQFFVPYQKQSMYCKNLNSDYNNKTCAQVGSQIKYREEHPFMKTSLGREYNRNYNKYSMWAKRNKKRAMEMVDDLYKTEKVKPEEDEEKDRIIIAVKKEISDRLNDWRNNTDEAIEMVSRHEITEEEFRNIIQVPPIPDRSPLMAKLKKEWGIYNSKGY